MACHKTVLKVLVNRFIKEEIPVVEVQPLDLLSVYLDANLVPSTSFPMLLSFTSSFEATPARIVETRFIVYALMVGTDLHAAVELRAKAANVILQEIRQTKGIIDNRAEATLPVVPSSAGALLVVAVEYKVPA